MDFAAVILAAGKSKRMKSALPKAVHPICGKAVTRHVVDACLQSGVSQMVVVVGHEAEAVKAAIGSDVSYALQAEQLGTGHAAMQAMPLVDKPAMLLLPGDAPLIRPETIQKLMKAHEESGAAATLLTAVMDIPGSYGRIIRNRDGSVERIVEAKDASPEQLKITEVATSIYCFDTELLRKALSELRTDNAQGEYYLTDTIEVFRSMGKSVEAIVADDWRDTLGINTRIELANAASVMRRRILDALMLEGVTIVDPATTYIDAGVSIGHDTVVYSCTVIEGKSTIGANCVVGPFARLTNACLGKNVEVVSSTVHSAEVADGAKVGPYQTINGKV